METNLLAIWLVLIVLIVVGYCRLCNYMNPRVADQDEDGGLPYNSHHIKPTINWEYETRYPKGKHQGHAAPTVWRDGKWRHKEYDTEYPDMWAEHQDVEWRERAKGCVELAHD